MEVLSTHLNQQRMSSAYQNDKILEYDANTPDSVKSSSPMDFGAFDLDFLIGRDVYHGHQRVFSECSHKFKSFLISDAKDSVEYVKDDIIEIRRTPTLPTPLTISIDAPVYIFECIFNFCYTRKLAIPDPMVPSLCIVARHLGITSIEEPCVDYLTNNLCLNSIGNLCNLIRFGLLLESPSIPQVYTAGRNTDSLERKLTQSVYSFVQSKAGRVVTSLTGQLTARLIVNLKIGCPIEEVHPSLIDPDQGQPTAKLIFGLLLWAHHRLSSGQHLARTSGEDNVQSDDEECDAASGRSSLRNSFRPHSPADPHLPLEARLKVLGGVVYHRAESVVDAKIRWRSRDSLSDHESVCSDRPKSTTADVRIALHLDEITQILDADFPSPTDCHERVTLLPPLDRGSCPSSSSTNANHHRRETSTDLHVHPISGSRAESETCLLARTTLGVGATSIWLGKLIGCLVGLSVKLCQPRSNQSATPSEISVFSDRSFFAHPYHSSRESLDGLYSSSENGNYSPAVSVRTPSDEEVERTMTSHVALRLARLALVNRSSHDSLNGLGSRHPSQQYFTLRSPMMEARAGMGAGLLLSSNMDSEGLEEDNPFIVVPGGFTRKGCLDSVELYNPVADVVRPVCGPRLQKPRGRLAVAQTRNMADCKPCILYACGGSTGSLDLKTVERLTSDGLALWLSMHSGQNSPDEIPPIRANRQQTPWQSIPSMNQVRCSPSAVNLCELQTGSIISNPIGSIMVAGGIANAVDLSSVEMYIPERDDWFMLPSMSKGRHEAACSVMPSKNLIVVAGGAVAASYPRSEGLIEALDPRCPTWISLPSPAGLGGERKLRGACLVRDPTNDNGLMLLGGFNGQETLNSTWLFDAPSWQWIPGSSMLIPRSNFSTAVHGSSVFVFGGFNVAASDTGFIDSIETISFS